jgi:two-component system chemotaxis response regulator CheB
LHGDEIRPGHIYVAPADNHLLVRQGRVEVVRGPKENGHRPAVDPLFRSAARAYGVRVVGVVLSGYQDCGTAGMLSIKARGGVGVVQDPETALAPDMPRSVLASVAVDHVVRPPELAGLLVRLAHEPAAANTPAPPQGIAHLDGARPGPGVDLVCPLCHGILTRTQARAFQEFRCHVGHTFSLENLAEEQCEELERALWASVRSLEENAALDGRLARTGSSAELRRRFAEKETRLRREADLIRALLLEGDSPALVPAPAAGAAASEPTS